MDDYGVYYEERKPRLGADRGGIVAWMGTLLGLLVALSACVLLNGGLIYRQDCAEADGGLSRHWSYEWNQPIPYLLAPSREGCETHSATRLLLSAVGISPLASHDAAQIAVSTAADDGTRYYAAVYAVATNFVKAYKTSDLARIDAAIHDGGAKLAAIDAPEWGASDEAALVAAWDKLGGDFGTARATRAPAAVADFQADLVRLNAITVRIQKNVIAHRR